MPDRLYYYIQYILLLAYPNWKGAAKTAAKTGQTAKTAALS